jgi:hypothetical protein
MPIQSISRHSKPMERALHISLLSILIASFSPIAALKAGEPCQDNLKAVGVIGKFKAALENRVFSKSLPDIIASADQLPDNEVVIYPLRIAGLGLDRNIVLANKKAYLITPHAHPDRRISAYPLYQYAELEVIDSQLIMKGKTTLKLGSILPYVRSLLGRYKGYRFELTANSKIWFQQTLSAEAGEFPLGETFMKTFDMKLMGRAPKFHTFKAFAARVILLGLIFSPVPLGHTSSLTGRLISPVFGPIHQWAANDFNAAFSTPGIWEAISERALLDGRSIPPSEFGISGLGQFSTLELGQIWFQIHAAESFRNDETKKAQWYRRLIIALDEARASESNFVSRDLLDDIVPASSWVKTSSTQDLAIDRLLDIATAMDTKASFMPNILASIPSNSIWLSKNTNPATMPFFDPSIEKIIENSPFPETVTAAALKKYRETRRGDYETDLNLGRLIILQELLKSDSLPINEVLTAIDYLEEFALPEDNQTLMTSYEEKILIPAIKEAYTGDQEKVRLVLSSGGLVELVLLNQRGPLKNTVDRISKTLPPEAFLQFMQDLAYHGPSLISARMDAFEGDGRYDWLKKRLSDFEVDQELFDQLIDQTLSAIDRNTESRSTATRALNEIVGFTSSPLELQRRLEKIQLHLQALPNDTPKDVFEAYHKFAESLTESRVARTPEGLDFVRLQKQRLTQLIQARSQP